MAICVKESTIIRPAQETPKHRLRMSDLDMVMPSCHIPAVYFYRRRRQNDDVSSEFFDACFLKEALSKVLVSFYPLAGRLAKDQNGRTEVHCNGEGVLFLEAESSLEINDFGDFESSFNLMQLVPTVDDSKDASFYPLFMTQVTYFKCGGVCIGVTTHHTLIDGTAVYQFIKSWADLTRGISTTIPPFFDRTVLDFGVPNSPAFHHIEYDSPPSMMNNPIQNKTISTAILKLSLDQMKILKEKSKKDNESTVNYTRFEVVAAHIWRCVCKARGLAVDQATKLDIPTSGRFKMNPKIPSDYWGNVVFSTTPIALSGDIQSESLNYTTERIHKALKMMDDKYMKSALAFLKQRSDDLTAVMRDARSFNCPNLVITKLADMPMYDVDFGWGPPVLARPLNASLDGEVCILPSPSNDGSWLVVIDLETNHLELFNKFFYVIFL